MVGGRVVITHGVQGLTPQAKAELLEQIRGFTAFTKANDPHSQHDFGSIDIGNQKFFWKIDAYDKSLQVGSPDPAEPAVTTRVMTIMRADEY